MGRNGRAKVAEEFNIHHEAARLGAVLTGALAGRVSPIRLELSQDAPTHAAISAVAAKEVA
jgi:hypothetical protein